MLEGGNEELVFENKEHDFPQRIVYTRHGHDSLTVRIEGIMDGQERATTFSFKRGTDVR